MNDFLPIIMLLIIALVIFTYVVLDGFDLGVGINFLFCKDEISRDKMMQSIAPFWDGNETWMVLGAACLYGGFPKAFAFVLPYFYVPITLMIVGLIFRGVAFEFRFKDPKHKHIWSHCFMLSSILIAYMQGFILGHLILGTKSFGPELELLPLISGIATVIAYAILGTTWLIKKMPKQYELFCFNLAKKQLITFALSIVILTLVTLLTASKIDDIWFGHKLVGYLFPLPLLAFVIIYVIYKRLVMLDRKSPFRLFIMLLITCFIGCIASFYPYIVPYQMTLWQAAAPEKSLSFMLVGLVLLLPILISYTAYTYYIFRGRL